MNQADEPRQGDLILAKKRELANGPSNLIVRGLEDLVASEVTVNLKGALYSLTKRFISPGDEVSDLWSGPEPYWQKEASTPTSVRLDPRKHYKLVLEMNPQECIPSLPGLNAFPLSSFQVLEDWSRVKPDWLENPTLHERAAQAFFSRLPFASLGSLRVLDVWLSYCLNDGCLANLPNLNRLKSLRLGSTHPSTHLGLDFLCALNDLRVLRTHNCAINDDAWENLSCLSQLQQLEISERGITDFGLRQVAGLHHLEKLSLDTAPSTWTGAKPCNITDNGFLHLCKLTQLRSLSLFGCENVTERGIAYVGCLENLESLHLPAGVTDEDLRYLANLTKLRELFFDLNSSQVTDTGVAHLSSLRKLEMLHLSNCENVTGRGLAHLRSLENLEVLNLHRKISDEGLAHVANLKALKFLQIGSYNRAVTDKGIECLRYLTKLRDLDLSTCYGVTEAGKEALRQALPECEID